MKINSGWRPYGHPNAKENVHSHQVPHPNFSEMMSQQEERASREQLQRMLQQIHDQAERLSKSMTVRELHQYKRMVKLFLEETARRGLHLKETRGWDRRGRARKFKLLEEIDGRLLRLADELLEDESGKIELLSKVGELKGLLIHYFM